MSTLRQGTLGDLSTVVSGSAVDVSDLEDVVITVKGTETLDGTAAMTIEISQDGTRWSATPTSSAFSFASPSGSYALTGRVQFVRATVSAIAAGTFAVRYAGRSTDQLAFRTGTLGDIATATPSGSYGAPKDISDLEKVIVTVSGTFTAVVAVQGSYDGSDWQTITTFTNAGGSVLVPAPYKCVRCNMTSRSSGTAYGRFGGHRAAGKQRFGTLGDFSGATTGTAVDVSDLNSVTAYVDFTGVGTFAASMTMVIEVSADGTSWALAAGSSTLTSDGSLAITSPAKLLRARCSSYTSGSVTARFGGVNSDLVG